MRHRSHLPQKQRRNVSKLISLLGQGPLLKATTYILRNTCGKPHCKCARGDKHETLYVTRCRFGKKQSRSLPPQQREQVLRWIERNRKVGELLDELSEESWRDFNKSIRKPADR